MTRYSAGERAQIAAGTFFTDAELRAHPGLGRTVQPPAAARPAADPNNRPVSAEARRMVPVCAYCYEPGDEKSGLVKTTRNDYMHPECDEARTAELTARQAES